MASDVFVASGEAFQSQALIQSQDYQSMYQESLESPEAFWSKQAERLHWFKKWERVKNTSFQSPVKIAWYEGASLNASFNCLDRHLDKKAKDTAFIWEPDSPDQAALKVSFEQAHEAVCRMANVLRNNGVKKGDRVTIYMPMVPETVYAMLACARIGAVHSVVFAGFSSEALADRINGCESEFVMTADEGLRGGKKVPLKSAVDKALSKCKHVKKVFVHKYTGGQTQWNDSLDIDLISEMKKAETQCEPEVMDAEDPLFILYTSGSTNKPKGVLHTTGGYMVYASMTHQYVFDYKEGDIYWCAADVGWVTGHSYIVYGPLANGATSVLFEGVPTYPSASRIWEIVDKHKVSILYTSPTAIRALIQQGPEPVQKTSRKSLRLLGTVGEPINPEVWNWYHEIVGEKRCPIVDTWWQTETGGIMITPLPGAMDLKPGSASKPFFGIRPEILNEKGEILEGECEGLLCIGDSWPGQMRTVYQDHARFEETYFSMFKGKYFTGDGCRRDGDGYYWITGRVDDVLNVSGHRMGTAEVESALVAHQSVSEAAVVGYPHELKGQGIYAYVTLMEGVQGTEELKAELVQKVREEIGPIAKVDLLQWAPSLPKTRSGKIMRRILRKIAENQSDQLGDTSTLADPEVVDDLVQNRLNRS